MVRRSPPRIVTLTTDFGISDNYVGVMHGVIAGINPYAHVVDLCHAVPAQNIAAGAFLLQTGSRFFPSDSIHVAVVDPCVGGERVALAVATLTGTYLAPDNGLLSDVLRAEVPELPAAGGRVAVGMLGDNIKVVKLDNPKYWLSSVSATFHGRDIFAPVAAHLSLGLPLDRLGIPVVEVELLPLLAPIERGDGSLVAHVRYVDHFGNLVTDLSAELAARLAPRLALRISGRVVPGLYRNYAAGFALHALVGSSGMVEIGLRNGNAAALLGAHYGDEIIVTAETGGDER